MSLTEKHRTQITLAYCIFFYVLLAYKFWNGMLLCQLQPILYNTRPDIFTWIFMKSGLHLWLLNNPRGWILFDGVFYAMPLLYYQLFKKWRLLSTGVAILMLIVNWIYIQCYTLFPANSIESYTAWLLFPFLFITIHLRSFYFILHSLRYFFLFFFTSAAVWKFIQGGIFNIDQMSGILLYQHKDYLATSQNWYSTFIYWLINHPACSYLFYVGAAVFEIAFVVGFFTKKADLFLSILFLLFLFLDLLIMRIPYWEISPFVLTLVFSKYSKPASAINAKGGSEEVFVARQ